MSEEKKAVLVATPSQTVGPYLHIGLDTEPRLGVMHGPETPGDRITLRVRVLDGEGEPLPDALVELWQADASGTFVAKPDHDNPDPGEAFYEFFTYLVELTAANKALYSALSERAGLDLAPTSDIGHELNEVQGDLLVRAQSSGAVRSDIDVSDLKALISGALAMQQHGASPELMLAILCDGLRPR